MSYTFFKNLFLIFSAIFVSFFLLACISSFSAKEPCQVLTEKIELVNTYSYKYSLEEKVRIHKLGSQGLDVCKNAPLTYEESKFVNNLIKQINPLLKY